MEILGQAEKIRDLGLKDGWHDGTALYKVSPPAIMMNSGLETTEYIVVAVSPETGDHGQPETKCFAADSNGEIFNNKSIDDISIDLVNGTVIGSYNPEIALAQLGYKINGENEPFLPPDYILSVVNDDVLAAKIHEKIFEISFEHRFIENNILWESFFRYSTFQRLDTRPGDKYFGYKIYSISGGFWNSDFSAKNGDISLFIYVDPKNNSIEHSKIVSRKLDSLEEKNDDKNKKIRNNHGCFPLLACLLALVLGAYAMAL